MISNSIYPSFPFSSVYNVLYVYSAGNALSNYEIVASELITASVFSAAKAGNTVVDKISERERIKQISLFMSIPP